MLERVVLAEIGRIPIRRCHTRPRAGRLPSAHGSNCGCPDGGRQKPAFAPCLPCSGVRCGVRCCVPATTDLACSSALPANKTQHKTALTTACRSASCSTTDNHRCTFQINYCMQPMWWTLARPSEVAEAEWTEIDLDRAQWRAFLLSAHEGTQRARGAACRSRPWKCSGPQSHHRQRSTSSPAVTNRNTRCPLHH